MAPRLRRERKYPLTAPDLHRLRWWHRSHGGAFAPAHPARTVSNVYFDSPAWDNHGDNTSGVSERAKCRLRWYGETAAVEEAIFEVKHRRNGLGRKDLHRVSIADLGLWSLPLAGLYRRIRPRLPLHLRVHLDRTHRPVLYNRFRREYYATPSGIRMTVDTDLVFAAPRQCTLQGLRPTPAATPVVVEFKYPSERRRDAEDALRQLPFRATRFSKYVVGLDLVMHR